MNKMLETAKSAMTQEEISRYARFFLQPIIDPSSMKTIAFEFLTRFDCKHINVEDFFSSVSDKVAKRLLMLQAEEANRLGCMNTYVFSLNVNASVLADESFIAELLDGLNTKVAFELTNTPANDTEKKRVLKSIKMLRTLGHYIWLDDYLSEDIPESLLNLINWDLVKIDKSVLNRHLEHRDKMLDLVCDVSDFGRRYVIIEGVETSHHHEKLVGYKCLHQGFYYGDLIDCSTLVNLGRNM
ncbi:EAL domain-containing protein [Vibrio nigripulchritudo]|uniref:EAL domain-containing protein n=1 Tax=Vibrio nigripulchritudo TaxID=28173 RepID=UPI0005716E7C|nr:EAL domain-containing protein [Vibrio nigripulchritudo]